MLRSSNNLVQLPNLANGVAIYGGGGGNRVESNVLEDNAADGGGVVRPLPRNGAAGAGAGALVAADHLLLSLCSARWQPIQVGAPLRHDRHPQQHAAQMRQPAARMEQRKRRHLGFCSGL